MAATVTYDLAANVLSNFICDTLDPSTTVLNKLLTRLSESPDPVVLCRDGNDSENEHRYTSSHCGTGDVEGTFI